MAKMGLSQVLTPEQMAALQASKTPVTNALPPEQIAAHINRDRTKNFTARTAPPGQPAAAQTSPWFQAGGGDYVPPGKTARVVGSSDPEVMKGLSLFGEDDPELNGAPTVSGPAPTPMAKTDPAAAAHAAKVAQVQQASAGLNPNVNADGSPKYPTYNSLQNPYGGLKEPYRVPYRAGLEASQAGYYGAGAAPVNRQALDNLTGRGLQQGKSPWLNMMEGRIGQQQTGYMDEALKSATGAQASAMDAAAMRGGLSAGAVGRIARVGADNRVMAQSNAAKWGADARFQAGLEDERTKLGILQQLPGQELALGQYQTGANQFDAGNQLRTDMFNVGNENQFAQFNRGQDASVDQRNAQTAITSELGRNLFNQQNWAEMMKTFAAGKQADAIGDSGKK